MIPEKSTVYHFPVWLTEIPLVELVIARRNTINFHLNIFALSLSLSFVIKKKFVTERQHFIHYGNYLLSEIDNE